MPLLRLHLTVVRVAHKNNIFLLFDRSLRCGFCLLLFCSAFPGSIRTGLCRFRLHLSLNFLLNFLLFRHIAHSHLSLCHYPLFSFALAKMFPDSLYCFFLYRTLGGFCFHPFLLQKCDNIPALQP